MHSLIYFPITDNQVKVGYKNADFLATNCHQKDCMYPPICVRLGKTKRGESGLANGKEIIDSSSSHRR